MTNKDLEQTGLFSVIRDEFDITIDEQLEEFEDRLEYIDIDLKKKKKLIKLCEKIKQEEDIDTKEHLFKLLMKEVD